MLARWPMGRRPASPLRTLRLRARRRAAFRRSGGNWGVRARFGIQPAAFAARREARNESTPRTSRGGGLIRARRRADPAGRRACRGARSLRGQEQAAARVTTTRGGSCAASSSNGLCQRAARPDRGVGAAEDSRMDASTMDRATGEYGEEGRARRGGPQGGYRGPTTCRRGPDAARLPPSGGGHPLGFAGEMAPCVRMGRRAKAVRHARRLRRFASGGREKVSR